MRRHIGRTPDVTVQVRNVRRERVSYFSKFAVLACAILTGRAASADEIKTKTECGETSREKNTNTCRQKCSTEIRKAFQNSCTLKLRLRSSFAWQCTTSPEDNNLVEERKQELIEHFSKGLEQWLRTVGNACTRGKGHIISIAVPGMLIERLVKECRDLKLLSNTGQELNMGVGRVESVNPDRSALRVVEPMDEGLPGKRKLKKITPTLEEIGGMLKITTTEAVMRIHAREMMKSMLRDLIVIDEITQAVGITRVDRFTSEVHNDLERRYNDVGSERSIFPDAHNKGYDDMSIGKRMFPEEYFRCLTEFDYKGAVRQVGQNRAGSASELTDHRPFLDVARQEPIMGVLPKPFQWSLPDAGIINPCARFVISGKRYPR